MPRGTTKKTASEVETSERLRLADAIFSLTSKMETFQKATDYVKELNEETVKNLDREIETRKIDLEDLERDISRTKKNAQIDVDQFLKEYRYEGACKILKEQEEIPIDSARYQEMEDELEALRGDRTEEMAQVKADCKKDLEKSKAMALRNQELEFKAKYADLTAEVKQQKHEIEILNKTLENLQGELAAQRQLTKDVANAAGKTPTYVPTMNNQR